MFARGITHSEYATLTEDDRQAAVQSRPARHRTPPGSTIKPVIALVALTYHVIDRRPASVSATARFTCRAARICIASRQGRAARRMLDLTEAIARSCDVYFYQLANEMGIDRIAAVLAPFGFGQLDGHRHQRREARPAATRATGSGRAFKLPPTSPGSRARPSTSASARAILLVTPLQLAHFAGVSPSAARASSRGW